jgi:glycerol kinase
VRHILAIDQGTTGSTCLVFDEAAHVRGRGYAEITQRYPRAGWVEHDPEEILQRTLDAARTAISQAGVVPDVIGITNQRETVVLWDRRSGKPVAPAIVWQDRRTEPRCRELVVRSAAIAARTGLVVDPYFSATKIEWLLRDASVAELAVQGHLAAGTVDSWLVWKLTDGAVHATDPTNASRTMLFDIDRREWSDEMLALFDIPRAILPEVRPSAGDFGTASAGYFGSPIHIRGVAGDQQAALFGQGCWDAGAGKNTYGTGAFLLVNAGAQRPALGDAAPSGLLTTIACAADGSPVYALEASIFIAGAAIQWLRDGLGILAHAGESEALARSVASCDGVTFVPAFVGLGAPYWEPKARGAIFGLTRGSTRAHLARAALEAMAYSTRDVIDLMSARISMGPGGAATHVLRVDGGAAANEWLMQFQADVLGVTVERPLLLETTALGAAALAAITTGIWRESGDFLGTVGFRKFEPSRAQASLAEAHEGYLNWKRAVGAVLWWSQDESVRVPGA